MDWTNVYDESGEDEFIYSTRKNAAPRLSRLVSNMYYTNESYVNVTSVPRNRRLSILDEHEESYGSHRIFELGTVPSIEACDSNKIINDGCSSYTLGALYCLTINYVLGVGCLGIPYAFAKAGFMLCGSIIFIVTILSFLTVMWIFEVGCRAEADVRHTSRGGAEVSTSAESSVTANNSSILTEGSRLLKGEDNGILKHAPEECFDPEHYEVIDLVSKFLGPFHATLYQLSLLALMYVGLLAYSQVFCGAISVLMSRSWIKILPQLIFGMIVVPLSCLEIDEQISIQFLMAIVRFLSIFIMVGGSVLALLNDKENSIEDEKYNPPYFAQNGEARSLINDAVCFSGFGVAFSTALFSQLFQHSVPGLVRPLKGQKDKEDKVLFVFGAALFTTCALYIILGISAASYFGSDTQSSINLNFANFSFGLRPETSSKLELIVCQVASNIVVMFPALDTLSVFPLIANTLGNNLLAASNPGFLRWIKKLLIKMNMKSYPKQFNDSNKNVGEKGHDDNKYLIKLSAKIATIFWRLVASIPPLVISFWAYDLSFSLLLAGVAGIYVAFFAPSMLQIVSCRREKKNILLKGGCLPSHLGNSLAYAVIIFATFALCVVLFQIRDALR